MISMKIVGAEELARALERLPDSPSIRRTLKRALLKAAEPIAVDARRRARRNPDGPPAMADRVAATATLSRRQRKGRRKPGPFEAEVFIGAAPKGPGVLVEFGTAPRRHKSGKYTGQMPAFPFMRPAWEAGKKQALSQFGADLGREIEATARRVASKKGKRKP